MTVPACWCHTFRTNENLLQEFALNREHLHSPVAAVRHVYESVVRHSCGMHGIELFRTSVRRIEQGSATLRFVSVLRLQVGGLVSESTPHPFERAGIRVKHDHAAIDISVGNEYLVRLGIHKRVGWAVQILSISVALALAAMSDLQQKFSIPCELKLLIVMTV